ncbi:hypothetical protein ACLOAU_04065 [Niabella sp. CJ426]|uniref:hypothetical protein n=1 Tax=Niabella sp. CJ426 TaxID=3393740 RepID=UPI003D05ECA8
MEKKNNLQEVVDYAIAKLESKKTMSAEDREMYKKLIIEKENLSKTGYKASWNPIWSIVTNLLFRVGEEIIDNL